MGPDSPAGIAKQVHKVNVEPSVPRIRIKTPLEVSQGAIGPVVSAVMGERRKALARAVRGDEGGAAGPCVEEGGLEGAKEISLRRHVHDRVMDEHAIERPAEPDGPHVSAGVPALWVKAPARGQHSGREVHQGEVEPSLQVEGVVAAARAQFQNRSRRSAAMLAKKPAKGPRFYLVIGGAREKGPPRRQIAIELGSLHRPQPNGNGSDLWPAH